MKTNRSGSILGNTLLIIGGCALFSLGIFGFLVFRAVRGNLDTSKLNDIGHFTQSTTTNTARSGNATLVTTDDPSLGPANAKVTIVEFADFECPFCQASVTTLKDIVAKYPKDVRIIFRDYPNVAIHDHAFDAALAAGCMQDQGKFWQYHDLLYDNQNALTASDLQSYAQQANADVQTFSTCLSSRSHTGEVQADYNDGVALGVAGTPTWFVNGVKVEGAIPFATFKKIIDAAKRGKIGKQTL